MTDKSIDNFYSVRGGAALLVFIAHAPILNQHPSLGAVAVWTFFTLSGFLLYFFYENLSKKDFWLKTPTFWWRRFFRIIPAYFFYLVCYAIIYYLFNDKSYLKWLESHFLFSIAEGHFWSVKLEVLFYILFPFSIFILLYFNIWARFFISILMTCLIFYFIEEKDNFYIQAASIHLKLYLTPFFIGITFAIIRDKIPINFFAWLFWIGLFSLVILSFDYDFIKHLRAWIPLSNNDNLAWRYPYLTYIFCGFVVIGSYKTKNFLLSNKAIIFIGKISFSFYLSHILFLFILKHYITSRFMITLLALLLTIFFSYLSYIFIEKRAINFSKRFELKVIEKPNI